MDLERNGGLIGLIAAAAACPERSGLGSGALMVLLVAWVMTWF